MTRSGDGPPEQDRQQEDRRQEELAPVASIDDLLYHVDEPAKARRDHGRAVWIVGNVTLVVVLTLAALGVAKLADVRVPIVVLVAGIIALRALWLVVTGVDVPGRVGLPPRRTSADDAGRYVLTSGDLLRTAVRRWEQRLQAPADAARFSSNVLPVLAELTDERLRQRHGITRDSDPARARELLGEPLWQVLTDRGRKAPKAKEWGVLVAALEQL